MATRKHTRKNTRANAAGSNAARETAGTHPGRPIESYAHAGKERVNNPPVGLVTPKTDPDAGRTQTYAYDPHIDPQLHWAGKAEHTSFDVPTVSLHVHERIDTRTIVEAVRKRNGDNSKQGSLFEEQRNIPLRQEIEFYKHSHNWSNRLVAGDSLLVMNSLLQKENMAGKVQCIYMDPPYGIKYGSNFQPFVNKRDVKDGKDEDLTAEPEMIKAFRDTWELGIHSYLSYMRDRLLLARELLTDSESVFVQIGDENVHRVSAVLDDIFGSQNHLATISFATTSGSSASHLPQVADYLLWYAKDKERAKYRQLYEPLNRAEVVQYFNWDVMVELPNGDCRKLTAEERFDPDEFLPEGARIYRRTGLDSQGVSTTGRSEPYEWNEKIFHCAKNRQWSISKEGMDRLAKIERLEALEGQDSLMWKKYEEEVPGRRINKVWPAQMYPSEKKYVVETSVKAIQRCILMTTDPGDLVFDPTCGSGTTAYVAEQWGRRWITCDTSRVATTLAKQRLMTATFDYYNLAYPDEGVGSGFQYQTVAKVSPSILAGDAPSSPIALYDQPLKDTKRARVTGPFTVEAVPSPTVQPIADMALTPALSQREREEGNTAISDRESEQEFPSPRGRGIKGEGEKPPLDPKILKHARALRKQQTDAETLLWSLLRNKNFLGLKFRRQHPVHPYILDFYCHEAQLGVELDGGQHNEAAKQSEDKKRTECIRNKGIEIIRFWNNELLQETDAVLERLYDALTPTLSRREREEGNTAISHRESEQEFPSPRGRGIKGEGKEETADASIARSGETLRQNEWRDELLKTGIRGKSGQRIAFSRIEPLPCRWLHADAETRPDDSGDKVKETAATAYTPRRAVVSFGPEHAPLEQRQVERAWEEARTLVPRPEMLIFAAFQFDPEAAKDIDELAPDKVGMTLIKVQMNADMHNEDLKKKRTSNESFWLMGQPEVTIAPITTGDHKGKWQAQVHGFDYFNTKTGALESGGANQIAVWMLDTDYDGRSLYPSQVFFPMAGDKDGWAKLAKHLNAEIDGDMIEAYRGTVSLPFEAGGHGRIAVKIVDDRGIESLRVVGVGQ